MRPESLGELPITGQTVFEQQGAYRGPTLRQAGMRFEPIDMPRGPRAPQAAPLKAGTMYSFHVQLHLAVRSNQGGNSWGMAVSRV